jgi:hypothetical protein
MPKMTQGTKLVIMQDLETDKKIIHIVKPCSTSAASTARLTIKDSCQVVYLDKERITFHVKS